MTLDPAPDHGLASTIVYGPLVSRRYGITYGVNLLPPAQKRCDWNCVYCQLGYTDFDDEPGPFPSPDDVGAAVLFAPPVDGLAGLVICGNGEPTLHPQFAAAVEAVREARDARFPGVPVVCLTNAAEIWRREVLRALLTLDDVAVKLDAGTCAQLQRVNLPVRPTCVEYQIRAVKKLDGATIQSCFFEGPVANADEASVAAWLKAVERAMPRRVDLYTLSRPTPAGRLRPLEPARLAEIAVQVEALGVPVRSFGA